MIGSAAIDVAIGLMFTYFVFALLCSGITELVALRFNLRGRLLQGAMRSLLGDRADEFFSHPLIRPLGTPHLLPPLMAEGEGPQRAAVTNAPSYISASTFARTVIGLVQGPDASAAAGTMAAALGTMPGAPHLEGALDALYREAAGDMWRFQQSIEAWFNDWMDRLTGLYKRNTKRILLTLSLVVTLAFNVNTLLIGRTLWREPTVRAAVTQAASQPTTTAKPQGLPALYQTVLQEEKVGVPIGWTAAKSPWGKNVRAWLWAIVGWLITAGALTFGAPFWFDLLGRLNSLRSTGPPPGSPTANAS